MKIKRLYFPARWRTKDEDSYLKMRRSIFYPNGKYISLLINYES